MFWTNFGTKRLLGHNFLDLLSDKMLKMFNESLLEGTLPPRLREALMSVIFKPGRNVTLCYNYRPISSINSDSKTLAKILAMRLGRFGDLSN